ncbi:hypothetical protein EF405_20100 [Cyclobacteriaceae bacterium YHN15]|nr:hypothetical protein EF405_20100 [Cyclobacteriaceae bacterium YHN15]
MFFNLINYRQLIKNQVYNIPGWRTNRKIVVIESDDWGMLRMASKRAYEKFLKLGYPVDRSVYSRFDALEQNDDLTLLMDVLSSVKDKHGNPAKFTINNIVANPDFQKIRSHNFESYFFEPYTETLKKNQNSDQVMELYRQGLNEGLFQIQFHGREHVHVNNWLNKLRSGDRVFLDAFEEGMFTLNNEKGCSCRFECLDAMATYSGSDFSFIQNAIKEGTELFKQIWEFSSSSIIAPCYTWPSKLENDFKLCGIKYVQGSRAQREPTLINMRPSIKRHFMGQKSKEGLIYLIRNVNFEQAENANIDIVPSALKEIESAFFWRKPAIISSHRVNYIGSIVPENRNRNLVYLKKLLNRIVEKHPTVEFMSSDQLGDLIAKS